jgi:hypothetical protein
MEFSGDINKFYTIQELREAKRTNFMDRLKAFNNFYGTDPEEVTTLPAEPLPPLDKDEVPDAPIQNEKTQES